MAIKNIFKKIFSKEAPKVKETSSSPKLEEIKKKWMQDPTVKEWDQKGWLKEENQDVLDYLFTEWEKRGELIPPVHRIKSNAIAEYGKKYNYDILVETGTYLGKMIDAQKDNFKRIISIEIDKKFHEDAIEKFKNDKHISFYLGDSGKLLHDIVKILDKPAIFWLDAHYNSRSSAKLDKDCPIFEELDAIFKANNPGHVLLVDDARLFIGKNDYPTIPELENYVKAKRPEYKMEVKNDIIRFAIN